MKRYGLVLMVVGLVFVLAGCGKSKQEKASEEAAEKIVSRAMSMAGGEKMEVDVDGETVRFTSEEGTVTIHGGEDARLPDGFAKDIPVYKKASVMQSTSRNANEFSVALQSADDVETIAGFYAKQMASEGWQIENDMNMGGRIIRTYRKDNRMVNLMIFRGDEQTVITISGGLDS